MDTIFYQLFERNIEATYFAPGRINLIGEHIDYNGGKVLPCALTFGTTLYVAARTDRTIRLYSNNFPNMGCIECTLDDLSYNAKHDWANYPKGVLAILAQAGYHLSHGFDALIDGTIPNGAGLSSSASIELVTAIMVEDLGGFMIDRVKLVQYCQQVENDYIGVNSGIMDQFVIGMAKQEHALLLDCNTLTYEHYPLKIDGYKIVIANTNKRRELADSKYNERRGQCDEALRIIQRTYSVHALCEINLEQLEAIQAAFSSPLIYQRARHAISEHTRVLAATTALQAGDFIALGQLMDASHDSLRDDYDVTGLELNTIVDLMQEQAGVLGARMTGAGFGGCAIALVKDEQVDACIAAVDRLYEERIGYKADFYIASVGTGVYKEINVYQTVENFVAAALEEQLITSEDYIYTRNQVCDYMQLAYRESEGSMSAPSLLRSNHDLVAWLAANRDMNNRDQVSAKLMDICTPKPSAISKQFWTNYQQSPIAATDYFYHIESQNNYIQVNEMLRNIKFQLPTQYGDFDITINLAKPEKDPKEIAAQKDIVQEAYPLCPLCKENEGFSGDAIRPPRQNLRLVPLELNQHQWYLQYSPYAYYDEHAIVLRAEHAPMRIGHETFTALFDFIDLLPHYFIGSNADLPIVGGSILSHDHFQAGRYEFPLMRAKPRASITFAGFETIDATVLDWPMICICLKGSDRAQLLALVDTLFTKWQQRSDGDIHAFSGDMPHNTITPIVRMKDGLYEFYVVLRNNRVTDVYPDGIFHPHVEIHNIKKENIGLIEVMGLAVLPGRLATELRQVADALEAGDVDLCDELSGHQRWYQTISKQFIGGDSYQFVLDEAGKQFVRGIEHSGVFKDDLAALQRFLLSCAGELHGN